MKGRWRNGKEEDEKGNETNRLKVKKIIVKRGK